ncbi:MAG: 50S ribosomal protein L15 [Ignavibacteria bacterium]
MDILSNLKYAQGSRKKRKRVGRGVGSGHGKTSCRGHNGQKSRSGAHIPAWFEGGQMPLQRRIPKFGFTNRNRISFQVLNLGKLQTYYDNGTLKHQSLNPEILFSEGIVSSKNEPIKILGEGDFKQKLDISAHRFSKAAVDKIVKNGGNVTFI